MITAHRDASIYEPIPEDTWILCFGWFMHSLFRMRHGFPLHRNLRPIFVSFHCNKRELLTPEAIDYLKRYGPVGCRDWTTVDLLLSIGVPAFFSGCLTTTIDTVFPDLAVAAGGGRAGRLRRRPRRRGAAGRRHVPPLRATTSGAARSSRTSTRRWSCSSATGASTGPSSRRGCTATCRSARSASTWTSAPRTARTSASTA